MKTVYGWLVTWPNGRISIDLFFSSKEKFKELLKYNVEEQQLVEIIVTNSFDNLDYIPDNY